jgi:hypothetical protein
MVRTEVKAHLKRSVTEFRGVITKMGEAAFEWVPDVSGPLWKPLIRVGPTLKTLNSFSERPIRTKMIEFSFSKKSDEELLALDYSFSGPAGSAFISIISDGVLAAQIRQTDTNAHTIFVPLQRTNYHCRISVVLVASEPSHFEASNMLLIPTADPVSTSNPLDRWSLLSGH